MCPALPTSCQSTHPRTQLRSRRPHSLTLHLLSQQVGSRLEFRFRSREVRRGFLREYFPFGFTGKGRDTISSLSFRSYWNQRSPLVYLFFCDSEALGALITTSLPSKAMPDDRRVEWKSHHEPPSLPLLLLPLMQSWWLLLRRLHLPLNELRRCPSPRAKSFSVEIVGAVAPSLAVHQSVEGYY